MRFGYYIINEDEKITKAIKDGIYKQLFQSANYCNEQGVFQCHCSVKWIETELKDGWYYKFLKFIHWDELKWKEVAETILENPKRFRNKHINNLLEDISDLTVNGHSLLKYKNYYIDPYLKSLKVNEKDIQEFGNYWENTILKKSRRK